MENQPKQQASGEEKEVDLGVLFSVFEKVGHRLISAIRSFFFWLVDGLILLLIFLRRRFLLILAGLVLSLVPWSLPLPDKGQPVLFLYDGKGQFRKCS